MSANLTKRDIVLHVYSKLEELTEGQDPGCSQKTIRDVVQLALDTVADALAAGQNVELRNFGVFEVQVRKARVGRNPNKPEKDVIIPRRAVIKFKSGKELKARLRELDLGRLD
jgi:DNA-binding protein HU-beta/integration host factor subunit alpha